MSFASFLSDPQAVRDYGDFLIEFYPKNPAGVETPLRFSRKGTVVASAVTTPSGDVIAAFTPFRKRLIKAPNISQSIWQPAKILSNSLPSFGSVSLVNEDGGLDQYMVSAGWTWLDCRCKVFFCDVRDIQGTISKISDSFMGDPSWSIESLIIPLKGRESLFSQMTSARVYRGTSYMLELSGVRTVSYGTPAALDLRTSLTLEGWLWIDTTPSVTILNLYGWNGATFPFRLNMTTSRTLSLRGVVAGVTQGPTSVNPLSLQTFYHIAVVISGTTLTFHIYNDDTQVTTSETFTGTFTSSTRDAQVGGTLVHSTQGTPVVWFDEWRTWNVARTLTEIAANRFRQLTSVPATCVHRLGMDGGTGTTVEDSSATAADGTISGAGTSTWLWAHEGGPELAGTPKPDVWGSRWGVAPIMVDPVRQGYQVAGGGTINNLTTYEGGNPHTMDASSASFRAYITTTPAAGHSLRYLPRGLFKLGSSPTLPVSASVNGYSGGALGYVTTGANIARDIITRRGPKIADPSEIDTSSFTTYNALTTGAPTCGVAIYQPQTISSVLDFLLSSGSGWWGYKRASTLFHVERFNGPAVTADYNFDQRKIISITPLPPVAVIYEVIVKYRKNDVVHSKEQVAASVKSTVDWTQWTQEWQEQPATDESLRSASAISLVVETALQLQADARVLADYLLATLKGKKDGWEISLNSSGLQTSVGETSTLSVTLQKNISRLGLVGSKKYVILSVEDNRQEGSIKNIVWG